VDYILMFESVLVIVSLYFLFRYGLVTRKIISEQRDVGDIVRTITDSFDKKINRYNEWIIDLLYRVDLLEATSVGVSHIHGTVESNTKLMNTNRSVIDDITTTELNVLNLLLNGPMNSIEVRKVLGKSREHVARIMKDVFEVGYVIRDESKRPFVYKLTELGKSKVTVVNES
jgi:predicted transcriptional regulator